MATEQPGVSTPITSARRGLRLWRAPLWVHAAALAVLLVAIYPLMSPDSSFTSDEGAYATQAQALEKGSWAYDYRAGRFDPSGDSFPIILSERGAAGFYTYVKHPAVPVLLHLGRRVAGPALGLHLLGLLGVLGTAVAAWLLAAEFDHRLCRPAFWMASTGPVLVNGYVIWAHAPSAAISGLALVCATRVLRSGLTRWTATGLVATVAGGALLRSEGLLFGAALAVVLGVARLRRAGALAGLAAFALVAGSAAAVTVVEKRWIEVIVGGRYESLRQHLGGSTSFLGGRVGAAWHELFQGHYIDPAAGTPVLVALVVIVGPGWVALHRWRPSSPRVLATAVTVTVVMLVVRMITHSYDPVTGLLAAWPVAVLGTLLVRWRGGGPVVGLLGGTVALFAAAVLGTQYPEGGGLEWGGRFLSPVLVPLAVLAVVGLAGSLRAVPREHRRMAAGVLVAAALASATLALGTAGALRSREDSIVAAVERHPSSIMVTTRRALPRLAWRADDRLTWMLTDPEALDRLLISLRARGVGQVTVVAGTEIPLARLDAYPVAQIRAEPALAADGLRLVVVRNR